MASRQQPEVTETLSPTAHKELDPSNTEGVALEVSPSPPTLGFQPCEKHLARGTQVSHAWIPDPQKLQENKYVLF